MTKEEYLTHPIINGLIDHSDQLKEITRVNNSIINKFNADRKIGHINALTEVHLEKMELVLHRCLNKVGELSTSRHGIEKKLSNYYSVKFSKSPSLGKKLFLDHYFSLHKPYDKVKESIWKSIFTIITYKETNF